MSILETERLILRELTPDDTDALFAVLGDPVALKLWPRTFTREQIALGWIPWAMTSYRCFGYGLWAVCLKSTGECIGDCGVAVQLADGRVEDEIGYHLQHKHWGKGYATEAAVACRDYALSKLGMTRLVSMIMPVNVKSRAVAERNGMKVEKEFDKQGIPHLLYVLETKAPEIVVRRVRLEDADSLCACIGSVALERKYLGTTEPFPLENIRKMVGEVVKNGSAQLVAEAGGRIVGWCDALPRPYEGRRHVGVLGMGLLPEYRGRRIGARLLEGCRRMARTAGITRVELEVYASNTRAAALYDRFKFEHEGTKRKARFLDGVYDDILCMAMLFDAP
ncbi:MAG: GNAT family N-acetyltransferase [Planctomycetes bacterium]|nr:GNAT family N-acetyltransferase [Planctomycetota bacterium]